MGIVSAGTLIIGMVGCPYWISFSRCLMPTYGSDFKEISNICSITTTLWNPRSLRVFGVVRRGGLCEGAVCPWNAKRFPKPPNFVHLAGNLRGSVQNSHNSHKLKMQHFLNFMLHNSSCWGVCCGQQVARMARKSARDCFLTDSFAFSSNVLTVCGT